MYSVSTVGKIVSFWSMWFFLGVFIFFLPFSQLRNYISAFFQGLFFEFSFDSGADRKTYFCVALVANLLELALNSCN